MKTVKEAQLGSIDGERMIAIMNTMKEIAEKHGGNIERKSGSIRGAAGASYEVKIGEVTIAIKRIADQSDTTLSDVAISFKSRENDQAKKQAEELARETIPIVVQRMSQITEKVQKAEGAIQQSQVETAVNRVKTAANSHDRNLKVSELALSVKIITASDRYQDCHKQQYFDDLQSIGKSLKPKPENTPKQEHSGKEMDAFKAIGKLDKLLDRAKAVKNIPIVSNIVRSQIRQQLDRMNGTNIQEGLEKLGSKKVEGAEISRPSMGKSK